MKILSVVGARPQFVKLSPIDVALRAAGHEHIIVHTGQHYAPELSKALFTDLGMPAPHVNLEVGSGSHARQTAGMLVGLEEAFLSFAPDWVLAYGDTNSTLAAALAAVKLQRPIAHLEAGLRSGNRLMPEEHNRVVTDHLSDLLLAPTETAMNHLSAEGLAERSRLVGDVMADVCYRVLGAVTASAPTMPDGWIDSPEAVLATVHRAENTDDPQRLEFVLDQLAGVAGPVLLVAHPRLVAKASEFALSLERPGLRPISSLNYSQMVYAVSRAAGVITDSGGLQKEAYLLGTPCITIRTETEWPETLVDGRNVVDPNFDVDATAHFARKQSRPTTTAFGDGHAAEKVVEALAGFQATGTTGA